MCESVKQLYHPLERPGLVYMVLEELFHSVVACEAVVDLVFFTTQGIPCESVDTSK